MYQLYHVEGKEETKIEGINIYIDMSVEELKSEIIRVLNKDINIGQISLFVKQEKYLSYKNVYNYLTFNDTEELVKTNLNNYLKNIEGISMTDIESKDSYTYDDLLDLSFDEKKIITLPLGLTVKKDALSYPYIVNPYEWDLLDNLVNDEEMVIVEGLSNSVLLSIGKIHENKIYFVLEKEVLEYGNTERARTLLQRIYFPENNMRINYSARETLALLHSVYEDYPDKLEYIDKGIKYLRCKYNIESISVIPLDNIFKRLHAVHSTPLIKYNPGKESDSILRLFSDKKSISGEKLLYLKASVINTKLVIMAKQEGISIYIEHLTEDGNLIPIILDIDKRGVVYIDVNMMKITMTQNALEEMLKIVVNSEIENINVLLGSGGFNIPKFESLSAVEVLNITYCERIKINSFEALTLKCIPDLFTVVEPKTSNNILMYYKRVSNFNKGIAQQLLINKLLAKSLSDTEFKKRLKYNYPEDNTIFKAYNSIVNRENATLNFLSEQGAGFPVSIEVIKDGLKQESIILEIKNINNLQYLDIIPKWLYSILLLSQNMPEMKALLDKCNGLETSPEPEEETSPEPDEETTPEPEEETSPEPEEETSPEPEEETNPEPEEEAIPEPEVKEPNEEATPEPEVEASPDEDATPEPEVKELDSDLDTDQEVDSDLDTDQEVDSDLDTDQEVAPAQSNSPDEGGGDDDMEYRSIESEERESIKLKNPNYFLERLQKSDPLLFEKATNDTTGYIRTCRGEVQRLPVALTPVEKENIDKQDERIDITNKKLQKKLTKENQGIPLTVDDYKSYSSSVKYGYDPKKPYYYICPQFWCIPQNRSISKAALMNGECGGWDASENRPTANVTSKTDTTKEEMVYERNNDIFLDSSNNYTGAYPGFLPEKSHSKGKDVCVPCCYVTKKNPKSQKERIKNCNQDIKTKIETVTKAKPDLYVLDANKMPLDEGRWGLLPDAIHNLLMENKEECKLSMNQMQQNKPCLLRYGVSTQNKNQSFLSCIEDILEVPNLKTKIIESINIDSFITYSNGNLIQEFAKDDNDIVSPAMYNTSALYNQLENKDPVFFSRVYSAMENFKNYILADKVVIDHTYLWDVISMPNKGIFPRGVNIIIIGLPSQGEEVNNGNVEMLCPTSYAGRKLYDKSNTSIILIKKGILYEPVYQYRLTGTTIKKIKQFLPYHTKLAFKIEQTNKYLTHCIPDNSKTEIYPFSENILLQNLIKKLRTHKGPQILNLCVDYNGKTVGMHVSYRKLSGFIPCYPSAINTDYKLQFIYEYEWQSYDKTTAFLKVIKKLDNTILCNPTILIEEDEQCIGILTEANQFIKIDPPQKVESELTRVTGSDYIDQEKAIFDSVDEEGVNKTKDLYLEQQFYNVFRGLVRDAINEPANKHLRNNILDIISNYNKNTLTSKNTITGLDELIAILHTLVDNKISFITYEKDILNSLNSISSCNKCAENYCLTTDEGDCEALLPQYNLINQLENNTIYFSQMADQILRYTRIQQFILNPNKYLNLANINYEVNENEKLILSSKLTDYLRQIKHMEDLDTNRYIKNNAYDNVNPPIYKTFKAISYYTEEDTIKRLPSTKFKKINLRK